MTEPDPHIILRIMDDEPASDGSAVPQMVPSAEERFDACLDNGGNCDQFLGIAAIDKAYHDGWNATQSALAEQRDEADHYADMMHKLDETVAELQSALAESRAEVTQLTEQVKQLQLGNYQRAMDLQKVLGDPRQRVHVPPADWGAPQNADASLRSPAATGEDQEPAIVLALVAHRVSEHEPLERIAAVDRDLHRSIINTAATIERERAASHAQGVREGIEKAAHLAHAYWATGATDEHLDNWRACAQELEGQIRALTASPAKRCTAPATTPP